MSAPSVSALPRTRAEKRAYWQDLLTDWQRSGIPVVDFCAQRNLEPEVFYRWRRRVGSRGTMFPKSSSRPRGGVFEPIALGAAPEVEVLLAKGTRVRLSGRLAERCLDQLLETLSC